MQSDTLQDKAALEKQQKNNLFVLVPPVDFTFVDVKAIQTQAVKRPWSTASVLMLPQEEVLNLAVTESAECWCLLMDCASALSKPAV